MRNYPNNISRKEFELIREEFESARKRTKPRRVDLYEMFCAILYGAEKRMKMEYTANRFSQKVHSIFFKHGQRKAKKETFSWMKY